MQVKQQAQVHSRDRGRPEAESNTDDTTPTLVGRAAPGATVGWGAGGGRDGAGVSWYKKRKGCGVTDQTPRAPNGKAEYKAATDIAVAAVAARGRACPTSTRW